MKDLLKAIILFILLIAGMACMLFGCAGCTHNPPAPVVSPLAETSIAKSQVYVERARLTLTGCLPKVPAEILPVVSAVVQDLEACTGELMAAVKGVQEKVNLIAWQHDVIVKHEDTIAAYKKRWTGDMLVKWFWIVVGGAVALWAGLGVAGIALGGAGFGATILNFLPWANPFKMYLKAKGAA